MYEPTTAETWVERLRELTLGDHIGDLSPVWVAEHRAFYEIILADGRCLRVSVEEIEKA